MSAARVDGDRLWSRLMDMAEIGPGVAGGSNRQALSDEDKAGRDLFMGWAADAGCTFEFDEDGISDDEPMNDGGEMKGTCVDHQCVTMWDSSACSSSTLGCKWNAAEYSCWPNAFALSPVSMFSRLDLPQPLGPAINACWPGLKDQHKSVNTRFSPNEQFAFVI